MMRPTPVYFEHGTQKDLFCSPSHSSSFTPFLLSNKKGKFIFSLHSVLADVVVIAAAAAHFLYRLHLEIHCLCVCFLSIKCRGNGVDSHSSDDS
jgi:hypothetical protein